MTETQWQNTIVETAQRFGWRAAHFRRAQVRQGRYATPVAYDAAGFPDLVLVTEGRILFVELKTDRGRVSPEQRAWHEWLEAAGQDVRVWRPRDWDVEVLPTLKGDTE